MFLELRQKRRNLFGRQPTERSSEPSEEDDDAGLLLPQLLEGGRRLGHGVRELNVSDLGGIHNPDYCLCATFSSAMSRIHFNTLFSHSLCNSYHFVSDIILTREN